MISSRSSMPTLLMILIFSSMQVLLQHNRRTPSSTSRAGNELGRQKIEFKGSLKLEFALDTTPFVRPNQPLVCIAHRVKWSVEAGLPEVEELVHLGKVGSEIIVLPDIGLQDGFEVGNAIEN